MIKKAVFVDVTVNLSHKFNVMASKPVRAVVRENGDIELLYTVFGHDHIQVPSDKVCIHKDGSRSIMIDVPSGEIM